MTPQEFLKAWLPNYWDRYREHLQKRCSEESLYHKVDLDEWIEENFDEALETFAKAQRRECAECASFDYNKLRDSCGLGSEYYEIDRDSIMEAPIPTPKNE